MTHIEANNKRLFYFDNLKSILIFLVVLGHIVDYYTPNSNAMKSVFFYIYTFHMPLFIFVSGFFAKKVLNSVRFPLEKVLSYITLYTLFKVGNYILNKYILEIEDTKLSYFIEGGVPWYLLAMAIWFCLLYLLKDIKPIYVFVVSIFCGLIINYDTSITDFLMLSRVVVFFPFFYLGANISINSIEKFLEPKYLKIISCLILIFSLLFIYIGIDEVYRFRALITGRNPYERMDIVYSMGAIYRMFFYGIALILSFCVMCITPRCNLPTTKIGERTLQIYILHSYILTILYHLGFFGYLIQEVPNYWKLCVLILSIGLTITLSLRFWGYLFNWATRIRLPQIYKN